MSEHVSITVYGASDDLIEIEGAIREEFSALDDETPNLLAFSDGTLLEVNYTSMGIWRINVLSAGFSNVAKHEATDEDSDYSDRGRGQTKVDFECRDNGTWEPRTLEAAQKVAAELEAGRARRDELQAELDLLALLERAYGRDGIPALIVEASAIPSIETEASRILAELGTSYRVELRTQKALKSGDGLADTLDVVVLTESGARPYESFSGGERTRLNAALRIALSCLLAHRRGAEAKIIVCDEPEFLDEQGQMALADVLRRLVTDGTCEKAILVSHAAALRDSFDNTIAVEKIDGRSRVAA